MLCFVESNCFDIPKAKDMSCIRYGIVIEWPCYSVNLDQAVCSTGAGLKMPSGWHSESQGCVVNHIWGGRKRREKLTVLARREEVSQAFYLLLKLSLTLYCIENKCHLQDLFSNDVHSMFTFERLKNFHLGILKPHVTHFVSYSSSESLLKREDRSFTPANCFLLWKGNYACTNGLACVYERKSLANRRVC